MKTNVQLIKSILFILNAHAFGTYCGIKPARFYLANGCPAPCKNDPFCFCDQLKVAVELLLLAFQEFERFNGFGELSRCLLGFYGCFLYQLDQIGFDDERDY